MEVRLFNRHKRGRKALSWQINYSLGKNVILVPKTNKKQ